MFSPVTLDTRDLARKIVPTDSQAVSKRLLSYTKSQFCEPCRAISVSQYLWCPSDDGMRGFGTDRYWRQSKVERRFRAADHKVECALD